MTDNYEAPWFFKNGHVNTLFTHLFCKVEPLQFSRERLLHSQGFSLFLDWMQEGNERLVIFSHGLESSSNARYIQAMGHQFLEANFDVLAWNLRNCAEGEPYEEGAHYHSGISEDLELVINHVLQNHHYEEIVLVGFSMGGNILLKYLGEKAGNIHPSITRAMAVSTPIDLLSCSYVLLEFPNSLYGRSFMKTILAKVRDQRHSIEVLGLDVDKILQCENLREFDETFTAPVHGFSDENDYYIRASAAPLLSKIAIPTMMINAWDDPMLSISCYPTAEEINNPLVTPMYTRHGGHVGYFSGCKKIGWLERQALEFLTPPTFA
jgi:hypothetical protein